MLPLLVRHIKHTIRPSQDDVVAAVLSRASNARRLVAQFTAAVGDPQAQEAKLPYEIDSGGFVPLADLKTFFEAYDELWPLEGVVSAKRLKALATGGAFSPEEKLQYTRRKLAVYFAEDVEGAAYVIVPVPSSNGRKAYWTEIREGCSWEGVRRQVLGIFPSVRAAKSALRRKGLLSARAYRPRGAR
ncbi:MAG: hypothetical protein QGG24_02840 [Vicinamibacterales bacterium]|nr:hypothetical protein [Vicinamibacterales bacterium]MDP7471705.1 hypothetical protein [Vicinamibacterales bacterium]MDP7672037.1 hypothetical protein [Vicinamibacterales bacterium]HJO39208.1 hypothetical protein [Vicinamibacterales bacterium]